MDIKRRVYIVMIVVIFIFSGCSKSKFTTNNSLSKYGVIETTSQEDKTYISFYDDNFEKIREEIIKFGSMGDGFSLPIVYEDSMFIVPKGIYTTKEHTFIMEYELSTGIIKNHETGLQNMNNIAINSDYVYGVNTMNLVSNIVKCNRKTKEIYGIEISDVYINYMELYGNELFAFGEEEGGEESVSHLYIFDSDTLGVLNKIDITDIGFGQYHTLLIDNTLYFPTTYSMENGESQPAKKLSAYNIKTGKIKTYDLKENYGFQVMEYGDRLLVTHFDPVEVVGNKISLLNMDDGSSEILEFNHDVEQLELYEEDIVILGNGILYRYNKEFLLIDQVKVLDERDTEYKYYTTGVFKM